MTDMNMIMADVSGFMKSRVILTAVELDLFSKLDGSPSTADELADRFQFHAPSLARILDCLAAFGYLAKEGRSYSNTEKGSLLSSFYPESAAPMVNHFNSLWDAWSNLSDMARGEKRLEKDMEEVMDRDNREAFIGAMHAIGRGLSMEVVQSCDMSRFKLLLDVGGASGTYTMAFLRKYPAMKAVLFDLEEVIPIARKRLGLEGFLDRVTLVAGDFYRDELPPGCDLALLSAIIHQNSPRENMELFKKIFHALEPGGALLIRDHIMDESRIYPPLGAVFAINMLVNTHGGSTYTFGEVEGALKEAGFVNARLVRRGERMDCLIEAEKPF